MCILGVAGEAGLRATVPTVLALPCSSTMQATQERPAKGRHCLHGNGCGCTLVSPRLCLLSPEDTSYLLGIQVQEGTLGNDVPMATGGPGATGVINFIFPVLPMSQICCLLGSGRVSRAPQIFPQGKIYSQFVVPELDGDRDWGDRALF